MYKRQHKYIADLLGTATIDKMNDGLSKGTSGSTSINFDRQSRELLTSEEISRIPDEDCIIFISGENRYMIKSTIHRI